MKEMIHLGKLGVDRNVTYPSYSVNDLFQHTKLYSLPTPCMYLCAAYNSYNSAIYSRPE
jgi:hypothetical protein